ncbi:hypothetical protein Pcinc_034304 [Petrolisthes cinctipes]|uniref:Uncharacterized protein n=1 Tax=Petrolisthes cinctipes TaxID=88211 RepID=A0AAE1JX06_PETCI|nr:hypothetical protein Pcinc_034304 [Petrolisthes cinctipes]
MKLATLKSNGINRQCVLVVVIKPQRVLTPSSSTMRLLTAFSSLLLVALCLPYQSDSISIHEDEITMTSALEGDLYVTTTTQSSLVESKATIVSTLEEDTTTIQSLPVEDITTTSALIEGDTTTTIHSLLEEDVTTTSTLEGDITNTTTTQSSLSESNATTTDVFILEEAYNSTPQQDETNNSSATTKTNHQVCQVLTRLINDATVLMLSSRTLVRFIHLMGIQPFSNYTIEQVASIVSEVVQRNSTVHNLIEMAESEMEKYPGAAQLCLQTSNVDENLGEVKVVSRVSRSLSVQNLNLVPVLQYLRDKIVWFNVKLASIAAGVRTWVKFNV